MGGGPKPEWTGIDKTVRGIFPEDYQLAGAILAGYGGLFGLFKIKSALSGKSPEPAEAPAATAPSASPSSDILPSVESPDFEKFLGSDAFGKFVESEESLMKWVDSVAAAK